MNISILDAASLGKDLDLSLFENMDGCRIWPYTDPVDLADRIGNSHIVITNRVVLNEAVLKQAHQLEMIALTATGYNNVDIEYCRKNGISVANVTAYSTDSVAQHSFSMLFYLLEQTRYYDDYIRRGQYRDDNRFADVSRPWFELSGKTWGIIGLGAIGRKVARIASAFGANPVYFSTSGVSREEEYPSVPLDELLRTSDIVSVHAPLNDNTRGLMGEKEFSFMKKSAFFLNLGRGGIVDEKALADALSADRIKGAGLDVLTNEPPDDENPLLGLIGEKLLITPHNAWGSLESRSTLIREVYKNVQAHMRGEKRNLIV